MLSLLPKVLRKMNDFGFGWNFAEKDYSGNLTLFYNRGEYIYLDRKLGLFFMQHPSADKKYTFTVKRRYDGG